MSERKTLKKSTKSNAIKIRGVSRCYPGVESLKDAWNLAK